jgi:hypothetical protein
LNETYLMKETEIHFALRLNKWHKRLNFHSQMSHDSWNYVASKNVDYKKREKFNQILESVDEANYFLNAQKFNILRKFIQLIGDQFADVYRYLFYP